MKPKLEAVRFMEFLRNDLEHNPYPVKRWVKRVRAGDRRRSSVEIDRVRCLYVDWLIVLEAKYGKKQRAEAR